MNFRSLRSLADDTLVRNAAHLVALGRANTAELVAHLAEIEERRLYASAGYSSMYLYCVQELKLSEDAALKRIRVARAARDFPAILPAIADGRLNLSSILLLIPHLDPATSQNLLEEAAGKTNAQIDQILAHRFPKPDVRTTIVAIPPQITADQLAVRPVEDGSGQPIPPAHDAQGCVLAVRPVDPGPCARIKLLSPQRFGLQTTLEQTTHDKLQYALDLLGSAIRAGDIAQVIDRALDALIPQLEKRKFGAAARGLKSTNPNSSRHIPAAVRNAVWKRDGGHCTFVSDTGHRCEARKFIEFDHVEPVARGGQSTVANVRLRCRAHNQLAAERALGIDFMRSKRESAQSRRDDARQRAEAEQARAEAAEKACIAAEQVRAAAEVQEAIEKAKAEVIPLLRQLGFRAEEARRAAANSATDPRAPLQERVRLALRHLSPPCVHRNAPPSPSLA
jgi:5-methylcytosine-specific restriction endonuclease McrA